MRTQYIGNLRRLLTNGLSFVDIKLVLPPRITKPSSASNQPTSNSHILVPLGQTLLTWLGTAPESNWCCIPPDMMMALRLRRPGSYALSYVLLPCNGAFDVRGQGYLLHPALECLLTVAQVARSTEVVMRGKLQNAGSWRWCGSNDAGAHQLGLGEAGIRLHGERVPS